MRKNAPRKWLHAILDLLPVILIPVFMIYSHRHNPVNATEINIDYKYQTNEVNTLDDLVLENVYFCDNLDFEYDDDYNFTLQVFKYDTFTYQGTSDLDEIYVSEPFDYFNEGCGFTILTGGSTSLLYFTNFSSYTAISFESDYFFNFTNCVFSIIEGLNDFKLYSFGWDFNITSTDYNVIQSVEVVNEDNGTITDVFLNNFNNTIDKYFNMTNIFGIQGFYDWVNINLFGGHAPTIVYSIWQIIVYEFVLDLLFLLYAVFMFLIDVCTHLIEKVFDSGRGA